MRIFALLILLLSSVVCATCLPECHPDYAEWVSVGMPDSWCIPRQCKGDTDDFAEGGMFLGVKYVFYNDFSVFLGAVKIKDPPEGPGLTIDQLAADFDHRKAGGPYVGYHRVGTTDWCIFKTYYGIKEPPKGPGIDPDCTECDTPGSGLQGPQLSLQVSVAGGAYQDTNVIEVDPNTILQIGINNTTPDAIKYYDGYISITGGHEYGDWTGNNWVYDTFVMGWTYFGTSPIADKDTWCIQTNNPFNDPQNPQDVSSWAEYLYNGNGTVTIELYDEFFELQDTLTVQLNSSLYSVDVLSPNGGEVFQSGKSANITWDTVGQVNAVDIDYSPDGGAGWLSIASQTANDGLCYWSPIPSLDSDNCLIRVSDSFNPTNTDTSDSPFTIFTCHIAPIPGDFNNDCYVDLDDLLTFCENWLLCGNPNDPLCDP